MITLKEAIKEFPSNSEVVITDEIGDNFKELSYYNKIRKVGKSKVTAIVSVKNDKLFFGIKTFTVVRYGKNIFITFKWSNVITIENNKVVSQCDVRYISHFYSFIERPIVSDLTSSGFWSANKSYMIKAILCKKIYSLETFYKELMLKSYQLKGFDWRLFREFISGGHYINILDLKTFTKDLRKSMLKLIQISKTKYMHCPEYTQLYDLLNSAIKLGEVVDFTWSERRVAEEHKRQTRELMAKEIDEKENIPIYNVSKELINTKNIHLLNTEKDVFAEGTLMHHCLYTNYFKKMQQHKHIAFHMSSPEECTFSCVKTFDGRIVMDQIYLAYDKPVQDKTRFVAQYYIEGYKSLISNLLDGKAIMKAEPELPF